MKAKIKYQVIYRKTGKYAIQEMCKFFGVSRSGYYSFLKRRYKPDKDEALAQKISICQKHSNNTYGYRRVQVWLMKKGIYHNPKTILRIMNKYGMLAQIRRRRKYKIMVQHMYKYANLLNRNFKADRPNQKWVIDISYYIRNKAFYTFLLFVIYMIIALFLMKLGLSKL